MKQQKEMIMPFGKYGGLLIEKVLEDARYCNWLLNQEWFESKSPELYKVIFDANPTFIPELPPPQPKPEPINKGTKKNCAFAIRFVIKHLIKQGIEPSLQAVITFLTDDFRMADVRSCWKSVTGEGVEKIKTTGRDKKIHKANIEVRFMANNCLN